MKRQAAIPQSECRQPRRRECKGRTPNERSERHIFCGDTLSDTALKAASERYADSEPYKYVRLVDVFKRRKLLQVRKELMQLRSTFKETDLFKVFQTGDLAAIDPDNPEHAAALPRTLELREAVYSDAFRTFVQRVTGCPPLTTKTDCSCNQYKQGGHLLCHDDVIGTRCISYILYLSRPNKPWAPTCGGGLELYPLEPAADGGMCQPSNVPSKVVPTDFGSMVLFVVTPGVSYHAVAEVLSAEPRISISGWFHAATPPAGSDTAASLAQLQAASGGSSSSCAAMRDLLPIGPKLLPRQETQLATLVNPTYLMTSTIASVREQLKQQGAVQLASFITPAVAIAIGRAAAFADRRDGVGGGRVPNYEAGIKRRGWGYVGPPQLQRYLRHRAQGTVEEPRGIGPLLQRGGGAYCWNTCRQSLHLVRPLAASFLSPCTEANTLSLSQLLRQLAHAPPFVQLLSAFTGRVPIRCASEVRRFRPGLDYTLAHVGTLRGEEVLEASFCFVDNSQSASKLWDSGEVGGFECYVSASEDDLAAAEVYRADASSEGVTSVHAMNNSLSLCMRPPHAMKFVKYVSAAAPGSRWDVAAEYVLGSQ